MTTLSEQEFRVKSDQAIEQTRHALLPLADEEGFEVELHDGVLDLVFEEPTRPSSWCRPTRPSGRSGFPRWPEATSWRGRPSAMPSRSKEKRLPTFLPAWRVPFWVRPRRTFRRFQEECMTRLWKASVAVGVAAVMVACGGGSREEEAAKQLEKGAERCRRRLTRRRAAPNRWPRDSSRWPRASAPWPAPTRTPSPSILSASATSWACSPRALRGGRRASRPVSACRVPSTSRRPKCGSRRASPDSS